MVYLYLIQYISPMQESKCEQDTKKLTSKDLGKNAPSAFYHYCWIWEFSMGRIPAELKGQKDTKNPYLRHSNEFSSFLVLLLLHKIQ